MLSTHWQSLPLDMIRRLRQIKSRLTVLAALLQTGYRQDDSELRSWIALSERLP